MENKPKIGISIGDINGIGLEVILKALAHPRVLDICIPIIYGSSKVVSYHKNIAALDDLPFQPQQNAERINPKKINVVNCWQENVNITLGKVSEAGGQYAQMSLETATHDLHTGLIDALVTAPINKESMRLANFPYPGHTEFLTDKLGGRESLMLLVNDNLRVGLVTAHVPLGEVAQQITKQKVANKIDLMDNTLKMDFGIERPMIAVLGLNPHASDGGVIGDEEEQLIRPAIVEQKKNGVMVMGPFPADGFFGSGQYRKFDGILAMYHDQGLVPFKTLSFGKGVNFTAGLPQVRTSPDHGTAMDIAGKNEADPASFRQALFAAIDITRHRLDYLELHANPIKKRQQLEEESDEKAAEEIRKLEE